MTSAPLHPMTDSVVIRRAFPDDERALIRLAALDSKRPLSDSVLIAERDGEILAAMSRNDRRIIADPFAPTADLVTLLRVHTDAALDRRTASPRRRAVAWRPRVG